MSKKKPELKRYEFRARIAFDAHVVVEASSLDNARARAEAGAFDEQQLESMFTWDILSAGREEQ